jgi:Domain of unknown function (DUF1707)
VAYGPGQAAPPPLPGPMSIGPAGFGPMGFGPEAAGPYPVNPSWLAATADRERTVGVLRAGFTEGRLTQDELDERVAQAYASRTYGELWELTADLPVGPFPVNPYPPGRTVMTPGGAPARAWSSAAALIITALVIFTLAAMVTAIITAHAQPGYGFGQVVRPMPAIQQLPDVQQLGPQAPGL